MVVHSYKRKVKNKSIETIYIFAEGAKREVMYFNFFASLDSRVNIVAYEFEHGSDRSPEGLFNSAKKSFSEKKLEFIDGDSVWIVFDSDPDKLSTREPQIKNVRSECDKQKDWHVCESNPCFEVWLYYHFKSKKATFQDMNISKKWKKYVDRIGPFDCRKNPILIDFANINSEKEFECSNLELEPGLTEVHVLGKKIYSLISDKIT